MPCRVDSGISLTRLEDPRWQELSDTPPGAHPRTGSLRKEVEWTRESETGVKRAADSSLQQLGRARKRERTKRIEAGSTGPLPRPGKGSANQGGRGEWVPGVFSE
ncbi:hypothetical protein CapIbe_021631 [Capra ibex]